jgi:hypothetical protein
MAQRKSPPTGKPAAKKGPSRPTGKPASTPAAKVSTTKPTAAAAAARKPPPRKPGKSIVNQKQRPWGLIITTIAIVLFAGAVVAVVVATHKSGGTATSSSTGGQSVDPNDPYKQPALPAAMAIKGVTYRVEGNHNHVAGTIKYDVSPPIGGNHDQYWANCTGTVYDHQLANENAVHMLEHGAVWVTYNPATLPSSQLPKLKTYVQGQDRLALTPYAGLKTPISLQAWGYQLFVNNASDPRIAQFIATLKYNTKTTPEPGASCTDPYWTADAAKQSRPGHPFQG